MPLRHRPSCSPGLRARQQARCHRCGIQACNQQGLLPRVMATLNLDPARRAPESVGQQPAEGLVGGFIHGWRGHPDDQVLPTQLAHLIPGGPGNQFDLQAATFRHLLETGRRNSRPCSRCSGTRRLWLPRCHGSFGRCRPGLRRRIPIPADRMAPCARPDSAEPVAAWQASTRRAHTTQAPADPCPAQIQPVSTTPGWFTFPAVTVNPIFTPQSHSEAPARPVPPEPRMQRRACVCGHWGIVCLLPRLQTTLEPTGQDRGRYHATVAQRSLSCGSEVQLPGPWTWIQKSRLSAAPRAATSRNTGSTGHEALHDQPRNIA